METVIFLIPFFPGIKYDAEKEEKQLQEARQRELQRIEETKLKAAEQGQGSALKGTVCVVCVGESESSSCKSICVKPGIFAS